MGRWADGQVGRWADGQRRGGRWLRFFRGDGERVGAASVLIAARRGEGEGAPGCRRRRMLGGCSVQADAGRGPLQRAAVFAVFALFALFDLEACRTLACPALSSARFCLAHASS